MMSMKTIAYCFLMSQSEELMGIVLEWGVVLALLAGVAYVIVKAIRADVEPNSSRKTRNIKF